MAESSVHDLDAVYKEGMARGDIEVNLARMELQQVRNETGAMVEEAEAIGVLKKIAYDDANNEMLKYLTLMRIRDAKLHRKGGLTWAEFCDQVVGESRPQVDKKIADIRPIIEHFGSKMSHLLGVDFRKIRYLGKSIGSKGAILPKLEVTDSSLIYGNETIPLDGEHAAEIEDAIDAMMADGAKIAEEKDATIRAKDKLIDQKQRHIERQEKEIVALETSLEHETERRENFFPKDEAEFLTRVDSWKKAVWGWFGQFDPEIAPLPKNATPRMRTAVLEVLAHFARVSFSVYLGAMELYEFPEIDDPTEPLPGMRTVHTETARYLPEDEKDGLPTHDIIELDKGNWTDDE